ncbi:MAG: choice-of-anchor D domain-containing protein [Prevotella sp.]|nr:choice-of-anchor D domain-containing protein [Prevotella sp.]
MKKLLTLRKRKLMMTLSVLLALFAWMTSPVSAQETLTVYDGTNSNDYVPVYGNWADAYLKSEFVIPAADLAAMEGSSITALKFYLKSAPSKQWTGTFQVFLKEVENTTMSAFSGTEDATIVYEGKFNVASNELPITFANTYDYNGGNLLVGVYQIEYGVYAASSFYGVGQAYNSAVNGYNSTSLTNISATGRAFIPKTTFTYESAADGPALKVQNYKDGETLSFGMVNPGATQTLTLVNPGTEAITVNIATTGGFTADESQVTIAANKGTKTVTITAPDETASGTITFTPTATGVDAITLNLSCTIKDPNKVFIDFFDNALPEGWETKYVCSNASSASWDFTKGYAWYKTSGSTESSALNYYLHSLISPLIKFTEGEKLIFKVKKEPQYTSYVGYLRVEYTTDGSTWTAVDGGTFANADLTTEWAEKEVTIPATTKQIRFVAAGIALDDIYGGQLSTEPVMKVTASDYAFGMITADATTTFMIINTGKSALTGVEVTSSNAAFTISGVPTSVEPGATAIVTVTMSADTKGQGQEGKITIAAPNQESATFNVSGYVADTDLFYEDFSGNALPDGWTMESGSTYSNYEWSFSNATAIGSSSNARLITPAMTVEEGEKMAIEAKKSSTWNASLKVYVSKDGGVFTQHATFTLTDAYQVFFVEGLEAGSYKIRFDGGDVVMNAVNGFHLDQNAPVMEMVTTGAAAFGKVTASAEKTYTVKNAGTGTLTVNIASDNTTDFAVSPAQLDIAAGKTADFTITFNYVAGNYGVKNANVTVTPTYNEELVYTIAATAKAMDPNAWDEDFEEGSMPTGWEATNWSVGSFSYTSTNDTKIAKADGSNATLITPRLQANENDVLIWEALYDWADEGIKVEYSDDEKENWKTVEIDGLTMDQTKGYRPLDNGASSYSDRGRKLDMSFIAPADGYYYLRFTSSYSGNGVDNFNGFKLALKEHDAVISETNIRSSFNQYTDYNVSVTVKEMVGKDEELTAKFFVDGVQYGEAVTETVPAGGEKEFVIAVRFNELVEGDAYFVVSNDNIELTSDKVAITTKAAVVLDEAVAPEGLGTGYQDKVVVKYTAKQGWNTICMPFALADDDLTALFGEGCKAYEFKSYSNGELGFQPASRRYAGYPYIVYCENVPTIEEPGYILTYVSFATEKSDEYNGAKFQGTFTPMAEGTLTGEYGVTPDGKIRKGGANATMPGFRGYFELPADAPAPTLSFTDENGETTYIRGIEAEQILKGAYNLQGQPVDTPTKGVYIINGKKVVIK